MTTLERIKSKLAELKSLDPNFQVFGAAKHKYQLDKPLTEAEVANFESKYNIQLPKDYRNFLLTIGNGGAGPYYGLESLNSGLYTDLDYRRDNDLINPSLEFPHTEAWNLDLDSTNEEEYYKKKDEIYYDPKWVNGALRISNYGCGVSMNLVVKGQEYGKIWIDDRCNEGGIFPDHYFGNKEKISFTEWYELWLDEALSEIKK